MEYHDRLKKVMKDAKIGLAVLEKACDVSNGAVSQWRSGLTKPKDLVCIAKAIKWSAEDLKNYLEHGIEPKNAINSAPGEYNAQILPILKAVEEVPVISMVQAGDWTEATDPYPIGEGEEKLPCPYPHGENTFAVKISGQSMSPEFPEGMIIFIDPSEHPENKQYCVAKLEDTNEATFKQYVVEDGQKFLKATNPDWPNKFLPINGNCHIIGRLIGVYMKY